ncbi:MAG: zinc dependent phospholipase C family protein [Gemmatimonadota bacterium]
MPGVALHCLLADQALADASSTDCLPFPAADPECRNAFLHGAIGPDAGYFPGADPFWSDLAHYVRAGDLARSVVREAATATERAFAWGWVTHLLADAAIHPLINRACGELVLGDGERPLTAADDAASHLRVEMGLDLACSAAHPRLRSIRLHPVFSGAGIRFLGRAYRATYALPVELRPLLGAHLAAGRLTSSLLALHWLLPRRAAGERRSALGAVRRQLPSAPYRASGLALTQGFLTPVEPAPWLLLRVREETAAFGALFRSHLDSCLAGLPDRNLDTGAAEGEEPAYSRAIHAMRVLAARARRPQPAPASPPSPSLVTT